ncbi:MAG: dethiobiotin synthase [Candidatus Hydrogenedentota bacterium]|nr:MAG: dethiobiotin synthase [Candidatus Hydrogenedentota bacterium]
MQHRGVLIASIGTDCGKTVVSAAICAKKKWDYFKPVQTGTSTQSDASFVRICAPECNVHPELYTYPDPVSPHIIEKTTEMKITKESFPVSNQPVVVESAGGLLSPVTNDLSVFDLSRLWNLPILLVIPFYLGSINHTLLAIEFLKSKQANVLGIVLNGKINQDSASYLENKLYYPVLGKMPYLENLPRDLRREKISFTESV